MKQINTIKTQRDNSVNSRFINKYTSEHLEKYLWHIRKKAALIFRLEIPWFIVRKWIMTYLRCVWSIISDLTKRSQTLALKLFMQFLQSNRLVVFSAHGSFLVLKLSQASEIRVSYICIYFLLSCREPQGIKLHLQKVQPSRSKISEIYPNCEMYFMLWAKLSEQWL